MFGHGFCPTFSFLLEVLPADNSILFRVVISWTYWPRRKSSCCRSRHAKACFPSPFLTPKRSKHKKVTKWPEGDHCQRSITYRDELSFLVAGEVQPLFKLSRTLVEPVLQVRQALLERLCFAVLALQLHLQQLASDEKRYTMHGVRQMVLFRK